MTQKEILECLRCNGRMTCREIAIKTCCDEYKTLENLSWLVAKEKISRTRDYNSGETFYELENY